MNEPVMVPLWMLFALAAPAALCVVVAMAIVVGLVLSLFERDEDYLP